MTSAVGSQNAVQLPHGSFGIFALGSQLSCKRKPKFILMEKQCRETTWSVLAEIHAEVPANCQPRPADVWMEIPQVIAIVLQSWSHVSPQLSHSNLSS